MIAIIQQYLEMNAPEQSVFEYNTLLKMNEERKYYIGNVIKFTVKAWFLRLHGGDNGQEYRRIQQKVYRAIAKIRNLRQQQLTTFAEDDNTDQSKEQQINFHMTKGIEDRLNQFEAKLDHLTHLMYQQMNMNAQQDTSTITRRL